MAKRLRTTDGYYRTTLDEDSSSGCSSAGPSGLRNYVPSPNQHPSFNISHRSPLNSTSFASEKSPNRYLPYTIRPLVLRAKRKLNDEPSSLITSTARRIMTALEQTATPVVDSVKIPFEPIVNSRPVVTPMRRITAGPPIMKSPLITASVAKLVQSPAVHMHIPKLVDFGTNTDLTMGTTTTLEALKKSFAAQECNGTMQNSMKTSPDNQNMRVNSAGRWSGVGASPAVRVQEPKKPAKPSKFGKAWKLDELTRRLSKAEGSVVLTEIASQQNEIKGNMCSKCKGDLGLDTVDATVKATPLPVAKPDDAEKPWDCPVCMVRNKATASTCPCCGEKKPVGGSKPATFVKPPEVQKPVATVSSASSFDSAWKPKSSTSASGWKCPTCMVENKSEAPTCVCCCEKNPNPPAKAATPSSAAKPWKCPTCMVENKSEAPTCVCCSEKNPNPSAKAAASSSAAKSWECPVCLVPNKSDVNACVCCGEKNPTATNAATASAGGSGSFKFGFSSGSAASVPAADSKFMFGAPKNSGDDTKSTFQFGVKPDSSASGAASISKTTFKFGADTSASDAAAPQSFKFGVKPASSAAQSSTPIVFGAPSSSEASSSSSVSHRKDAAGSTTSTFGNAGMNLISSTTSASSEAPKVQPSSTSFFGSFPGSPPNSFGGFNSAQQQWNCPQCPAKGLTSAECVGCGASKPKEGSGGPKAFKFEPFSGGRVEKKSQDVVAGEPEPKRKVPAVAASSSNMSFNYSPPEPSLKRKSPEQPADSGAGPAATSQVPDMSIFGSVASKSTGDDVSGSTIAATSTSESKPTNFLDALKAKPFNFNSPSTSVIPSTASASTVTPSQPVNTTFGSISSGNGTSTVSSTTGPPGGVFMFGANASTTSAPTLAQSSVGKINAPSSITSSTPAFNITGNNALNPSGTFFGAGTNAGASNGLASTSTTAPSIFGSGSATAVPPFGSTPSAASNTSGSTPFLFGQPSAGPTSTSTAAVPAAPAPFGASFNFTGAPANASANPFQFVASAPGQQQSQGGRKIKTARRRI